MFCVVEQWRSLKVSNEGNFLKKGQLQATCKQKPDKRPHWRTLKQKTVSVLPIRITKSNRKFEFSSACVVHMKVGQVQAHPLKMKSPDKIGLLETHPRGPIYFK